MKITPIYKQKMSAGCALCSLHAAHLDGGGDMSLSYGATCRDLGGVSVRIVHPVGASGCIRIFLIS